MNNEKPHDGYPAERLGNVNPLAAAVKGSLEPDADASSQVLDAIPGGTRRAIPARTRGARRSPADGSVTAGEQVGTSPAPEANPAKALVYAAALGAAAIVLLTLLPRARD